MSQAHAPLGPLIQAWCSQARVPKAVVEAAGGHLGQVVRLGLFLTDLAQFATVNTIMAEYFQAPYPARSTIQVAALPKGAPFEVEATLVLE